MLHAADMGEGHAGRRGGVLSAAVALRAGAPAHRGEPDGARPPDSERRSPGALDRGTSERPLSASEASSGRRSADARTGRPSTATKPWYALSSSKWVRRGRLACRGCPHVQARSAWALVACTGTSFQMLCSDRTLGGKLNYRPAHFTNLVPAEGGNGCRGHVTRNCVTICHECLYKGRIRVARRGLWAPTHQKASRQRNNSKER